MNTDNKAIPQYFIRKENRLVAEMDEPKNHPADYEQGTQLYQTCFYEWQEYNSRPSYAINSSDLDKFIEGGRYELNKDFSLFNHFSCSLNEVCDCEPCQLCPRPNKEPFLTEAIRISTTFHIPKKEQGKLSEISEDELNKQLYPESFMKPEYIICAAIHFKDGKEHEHQPRNIESGFVVCGRRHHNCFLTKSLLEEFSEVKRTAIQGFLTSKDRFVDRKEAGVIALANDQISKPTNCLFSEDLY